MFGFGRALFRGSRFLFWALAPVLLLFAAVILGLVSDWTSRGALLPAVLATAALLLVLQLYDRVRFHWAGRVLAGLVCLAYVAYLIGELATKDRGSRSAFGAFLGLLVIGVPAGLYALSGRWTLRELRLHAVDVAEWQLAVCQQHAAPFTPSEPSSKIGISASALRGDLPLNGLRHPPEDGTCGWLIWGGEEPGTADDFFEPMHVRDLAAQRPEILPYLALPPGWRFLLAPDAEDVWFDEALLRP